MAALLDKPITPNINSYMYINYIKVLTAVILNKFM